MSGPASSSHRGRLGDGHRVDPWPSTMARPPPRLTLCASSTTAQGGPAMFRSRGAMVFGTALLLSSAATPVASAADPPVTLRLAMATAEDSPVATGARAFIDEVAARSDGSIAIDPIWA